MARPRADLPQPELLRAQVRGGQLRVRATPGARSEAIVIEAGRVQVRVRAQAADGEANKAVEKLIARGLGIAASRCRIIRGTTSREKVLEVSL